MSGFLIFGMWKKIGLRILVLRKMRFIFLNPKICCSNKLEENIEQDGITLHDLLWDHSGS
jgi:hypothetical protein